jgi:hypothetical protein
LDLDVGKSWGKHYYFNTVDHDIQYDMVKVQERAVLTLEAATIKNSSLKNELVYYPDDVVSSYNNIISPSPVTCRKKESYSGNQKMPAVPNKPATFGEFIEIYSTNDDETDSFNTSPVALVGPWKRANKA